MFWWLAGPRTSRRSGTLLINGVPVFLAEVGDPLSFTGTSTDPGRDDLTLSWDWNDGAPAPDISTTHPVPHAVTETQTNTFTQACLFLVGFKSVDDDLAVGEDHVVVIITERDNPARLAGYWQHQLKGNGRTAIDAATLDCYLTICSFMSTVFGEVREASTVGAAHDVLFLAQNQGSALEQLDRELLVAWLNLANGAFDFMEVFDLGQHGTMTFVDVVAAAEGVRLNPGATDEELKQQKQILHHVNTENVGQSASM